MTSKALSARAIADSIDDESVLLFTSDASLMVCDAIFAAIEQRFLETGHPRNLTLIQPCNGFLGIGTGIDRFMHEGLATTLVTSILPANKDSRTHALLNAGQLDVMFLPMGMLYAWLRENAAGRPGLITRIGLGTFIEGSCGRVLRLGRERATLLERIEIAGQTYLRLKPLRIDAAFVRTTTADGNGNLSFERAQLVLDPVAVALAGKSGSGRTFAQVEQCLPSGGIATKAVKVPGFLVDGFCVAPDAAHSIYGGYDGVLANDLRSSSEDHEEVGLLKELAIHRAIAEIEPGSIVNLGVGMGAFVPSLMRRMPNPTPCTFVTEHGSVGGDPLGDVNLFGIHRNAQALLNPSEMFAAYTGGLLDVSILGFAQVDARANVNVSSFGGRSNGPGGFIDITANTRKLIFCGSFTTGGLKVEQRAGRVVVLREGAIRKFVDAVEEITYSSQALAGTRNRLLFVTERCVLEYARGRWVLKDVQPGIAVKENILDLLPFEVEVPDVLLPAGSGEEATA
jgi:propionate CoA-transferase